MQLTTNNLIIMPLSVADFALLLDDYAKMEQALGLTPSGEKLGQETQKAMEWLYNLGGFINDNPLWYTNWQIILKAQNVSIGSACFVGGANDQGEVTLGYGINPGFRNHGYMTEAAAAMCNWALGQEGVKKVLAETDKTNKASYRVLEKLGMKLIEESEHHYLWGLTAV